VEDDGTALFVLVHQRRVLEVLNQLVLSLDARKSDLTHFLAVELLPGARVMPMVKINHRIRCQQIDERVAHIALVLEIDGQVEKVVEAFVRLVHLGEQHLLRVLVGNVADHQCGAVLALRENVVHVERELPVGFRVDTANSLREGRRRGGERALAGLRPIAPGA